jgi:hypothetical protein
MGDAMVTYRPLWISWLGARRGILKQLNTGIAGTQHHDLSGRVMQAGNAIDDSVPGLPVKGKDFLKTEQIFIKSQ